MNKIKKYLIISSLSIIALSIIYPIFNLIIGQNILLDFVQTKYLLNLVIANSAITFEQLSNYLAYVLVAKDVLVIITTVWFQLLFILCFSILTKRNKGIITYIFALLFHILSYIGVVISYYFYVNLNVEFSFINIETYLLIISQVINSILFISFSYLFIKEKISNIKPITELTFLNAMYKILKFTVITLIILFTVVSISFVGIYNITLVIINSISLEEIFNLPSTIQYDVLSMFSSIPEFLKVVASSFEYKNLVFEYVNGEILINISNITDKIQAELTVIANQVFDQYFPTMIKFFTYYIALATLSYLHKKLEYKNLLVLSALVIVMIVATAVLPRIDILSTINGLIILIIAFYVLLMVDNYFANYKYTRILCEAINNFKLSSSAKEVTQEIKTSLANAKDKGQDSFKKLKDKTKKEKVSPEVKAVSSSDKKEEKKPPKKKASNTKKKSTKKSSTTTKKKSSTSKTKKDDIK